MRSLLRVCGRWFLPAAMTAAAMAAPALAEGDQPANGVFADDDTLPGSYRLHTETDIGGGLWGLGPNRGPAKRASFKADVHDDVAAFDVRHPCTMCHTDEAKDLHVARIGTGCRQCHVSLPIVGMHHDDSPMNPMRRHASVCAACHEGATPSFAGYVVHEPSAISAEAREQFPLLFYAVWFMIFLAGGVLALFIPFTVLWLAREYGGKLRTRGHGRADATVRLKRFTPAMRLWHLALIAAFMLLTVTGLAWMYIETPWGRMLASWFGGPRLTVEVHRITGIVMLAGFAAHIVYALTKVDWRNLPRSLVSPDMLVMTPRDIGNVFRHLGWIFGLCKAPGFDRWTWWGKFDYWAVWWGITVLGVTGLLIYNPVLTSDYMPGWLLNVMTWIHRIEAFLAFTHVFTIHFLVEHFRPGRLPFSAAMFDGTVPLDIARSEHPAWIERLEREGRLAGLMTSEPPVILRILYFGVGYAIMILAVALMAFAFANIMAVSLF